MADFDTMVDDSQSQVPVVPQSSTNQPSFDSLQDDSEKYSTPGQQAIAGVEGLAKGIAGPLATGFEKHILDIPAKDIRSRAEANPITHGISETAGLIGSSLYGVGEGALLNKAGALAAGSSAGIKAAALRGAGEMAALQATDEISKMMTKDPSTAAESAVSNIGLSAAIGGATGLAFGAVSPIWKATVGNKLSPVLADIKGRLDFHLNNPDVVGASQKELQGLHTNISDTISKLYSEAEGGIRGEQIAKAMPEISEKATAKINEHVGDINTLVEKALSKMEGDAKVKGKIPFLQQDLEGFQKIVTNPEATYIDKFNAVDDLKKTMQSYSKYGMNVEDSAFGAVTKKLAAEIRPTLEDANIWGKAAGVQKDINKAISEFIPTQKDMMSKFTTQLAGERVIDPSKINTYVNQLGKPQAEIKQEMMKNYLDKSSNLINTINDTFTSKGLEAPFAHTSTAVLRDTIGEKTAGASMVDRVIKENLKDILGKTAAGAIGSAVGAHVGQPLVGFLIGEHLAGPIFKSIIPGLAKPLLEMPGSVNGLKSALDYGMAIAKGEKLLNNTVKSVLKPIGQMAVTKGVDTVQRMKLDNLVSRALDNPSKFMQAQNGHIGDYLPDHQGALAMTTSRAVQYLQGLKPQPFRSSPLDRPIQPTKSEEARYHRALDIAQQPLTVLQHVKNGTLQLSDIQDLQSMYPALYKRMADKLTNELVTAKDDDQTIPYKTKMSISLFLGQPMDTSMTPTSIQDAQLTHLPPQPHQSPQDQGKTKKGTSTLGKTNKAYKTTTQAAESDRSSRE